MTPEEFAQRCYGLEEKLVPVLLQEEDADIIIVVLVRLLNRLISLHPDPTLAMSKVLDYIPKAYASEQEILKERDDN